MTAFGALYRALFCPGETGNANKGAKETDMKRRLQRLCSCALLCVLLLTALPLPAAAASTGFSDVPATHWAAEEIRRAGELGLFQGGTARAASDWGTP